VNFFDAANTLSESLQRDVAVECDLELQASDLPLVMVAGSVLVSVVAPLAKAADHFQKLANAQVKCSSFMRAPLVLRGRGNAAELAMRNSILSGGMVWGQLPGSLG
jgi:hypothetical protein